MKWFKLHYEHKPQLLKNLKPLALNISEYSFLDLYLFREKHNYEILTHPELFIRGKSFDGFSYLMPGFDLTRTTHLPFLFDLMKDYDFLFPVPEEWLPLFQGNNFKITHHEEDSDYLFETAKLASYPGRKLQKKRNFVHQFLKNYEFQSFFISEKNISHAFEILDFWQQQSGETQSQTDYSACRECLEKYFELPVLGEIHYVDGKPSGFIIGEELNSQVFDFHFAKGDKHVKGLYPFMYQSLAKKLSSKYPFINFEQDLGIEELRKAKSAFCPESKLKKYRVSLA